MRSLTNQRVHHTRATPRRAKTPRTGRAPVARPPKRAPWAATVAIVATGLLFAVTGCKVGPTYRRPVTPGVSNDNASDSSAHACEATSRDDLVGWWRQIDDPWLDEAVDRLVEQNLSLKEATARMQQAWARVEMQQAGLYPTLGASGSASRRTQTLESSAAELPIPSRGSDATRFYQTILEAGISTSWQMDLFGRIRHTEDAATWRYQATRLQAEALMQSLVAELVRRRVAMGYLRRRLRVLDDRVASRQRTLSTVERRYRKGLDQTSSSDVYMAREHLASLRARIPDLRQQVTEQAHAVDVLLGRRLGSTAALAGQTPKRPPPAPFSSPLPASVLDNRPDVHAAELRTRAAVAEIGVAVADLYPDVRLSGNIRVTNESLNTLFAGENLAASIVGNVMVRLFEGGRLRARIRLSEARARELAATYAHTLITAMREVETALSNEQRLARRLTRSRAAADSLQRAEGDAWRSYEKGLTPLLRVLDIQRRRHGAEQEVLIVSQAIWFNRIALLLALGGDWFDGELTLEAMPTPVEEKDRD